ncbi:MAG: beta-glucosidase [Spirochaetaceae bacterium]|nr:beta-glucosidase [Spirochaetaceae bacterium]|tara:strand:- start:9551 stop:10903 length:1353 start_codon:yes stop_codon:yes gene_type:complete
MSPSVASFKASDFGEFTWGAATAAYQIEGAHDADGKGPSIWDDFAARGKIRKKQTGNVACDHYNRMKEDVALMKSLGLKAYRFSVSWPRVLPNGSVAGGLNQPGLDFYKRLVDELLNNGIEPFVTLFHWDLPLELERQGGWLNRDIADHFSGYARLMVDTLGDRVKNWIILNEPFVFLLLGYGIGYFPPQKRGPAKFARSSHLTMLAQGKAARAMAAARSDIKIGTTISTLAGEAASNAPRHLAALRRHDAFFNRLYVDPIVGRGYPFQDLPFLRKMEPIIHPDDMDMVQYPFDFLGINHYSRKTVRSAWWMPYLKFWEHKPLKDVEITSMGWEVHPAGIYQILKKFGEYPEIPALYITENGAAYTDKVERDGHIHDERRKRYIQEYLQQCLKARREGVNLKGYFVWSLLDNLEWKEGYDKTFGIVHVDFETQKRTIKDSGLWYRDFLQS